jgi:phage baseplate assembly protein gpV
MGILNKNQRNREMAQTSSIDAALKTKIGTTPASIELKIDNKMVPNPTIEGISLYQAVCEHHTFEIGLRRGADLENAFGNSMEANTAAWLEKTLSLKVSCADKGRSDLGELNFIGLVTAVDFESVVGGLGKINIKGYSPTIMLDINKITNIWADAKSQDVINDLVNKIALPNSQISGVGNTEFPGFLSYYETPFQIIKYLAGLEGWWVYYDGLNFNVTKDAPSESVEIKSHNISFFSVAADVASRKKEIVGHSFDFLTGTKYNGQAGTKPSASIGLAKEVAAKDPITALSDHLDLTHILTSKKDLDGCLQNALNCSHSHLVTSKGLTGALGLCPGKVLKLTWQEQTKQADSRRESGFSGQYVIMETEHIIKDGSYICEFKCVARELAAPEFMDEMPEQIFEMATVVDNNDPEKLGRIKVSFDWDGGAGSISSGQSPFIRLAQIHTGADTHGSWMIPEIDDRVIVLIQGHHLENAVVIGSLYDGSRKPKSTWPDPNNNFKSICTRSGNEINFSDEQGKEKITITTKDGAAIAIFDASSGTEKLTLGAKKDEASIVLDGTQKVTIETKNSSCKISLDGSGQAIVIEAQRSITLKANEINLEGIAAINLKSSAKISHKANAMLDIDGGAMVNIKGGLIKLN